MYIVYTYMYIFSHYIYFVCVYIVHCALYGELYVHSQLVANKFSKFNDNRPLSNWGIHSLHLLKEMNGQKGVQGGEAIAF